MVLTYYASRTGTRRNLAAMKAAGFRLLVSRAGVWRSEGFPYCIDPGTWSDFQEGREFGEAEAEAFEALLDAMGAGADFIVLPDIVAGGLRSLELSMRWTNRVLSVCPLVLVAVQDGMTPEDLAPIVGAGVGIFLGGSTEWKLAEMAAWGRFCAERRVHYHVARVNTIRRMRMAIAAGANSADGSSATRFAKTVPLLDGARRQGDLLCPRRATS